MIEITRPTLVIDKEICIHNIEKMVKKANKLHLKFRPHFKTHQSAKIGEWFRIFGVEAITVSSVYMAEYFAKNGWKDITIAFPLNIKEINIINRLSANCKLNVLVENKEAATVLSKNISSRIGAFIKIDTGSNRTGIEPTRYKLINSILNILGKSKNINFKGFLTHNGLSYTARSTNEIFSSHFDALLKLKTLKQQYKAGYPNIEISIGDTPSCSLCTNFMGVDEIRPGNFIFYDLTQLNLGVCDFKDIAVKIICPVVAKHPSRNEIVIYGGAVHLSQESLINIDGKQFFGRIIINKNNHPTLLSERNYVSKLSQEHGIIKVSQKNFKLINIGDLIQILPIHSCLTANLARRYITVDGEEISTINT